MGYIVAPGSENVPWIRAIIERHERLKGNATPTGEPDVKILNWSPNEWRDQEHLHQQHHYQQQQQQQQEQQLRQQQYQQRQRIFRYRQQQQQQHQYLLQQQHQTFRLWQHKQHFKQETTRQTSDVLRVEVRAEGEEAQAERGGAPPTSQTTSKPQSLSGYPAVLFASQPGCCEPSSIDDELLECMENGLLGKPAQEEILVEELVQEPEQPQLCSPVEKAGEEEMGVLGKDLVVAGGLVVSAGVAGVEDQRPPFWEDGKISVWWPTPKETELEIATFCARKRLPAASREDTEVDDGKVVRGKDGEHAPPLQQQQQELQAAPPQEPWPPPAEQEGSGAGTYGEDGLGLEGFSITRLDFSFACGSDGVLSCGNGYCKESSGKGDDEEDTVDGRAWERAGIGTGRSCSRTYIGSGCEVAGRRLTRQRRARVREK